MIRERRNIRSRGNRDGTGRSQNGARTAMGGWATAGRGEKKRGKEDTNLDCQRLIARTPRQKPGRETLSGTHASRGGGGTGEMGHGSAHTAGEAERGSAGNLISSHFPWERPAIVGGGTPPKYQIFGQLLPTFSCSGNLAHLDQS